jgi:NADH pyrophosphatase NudC (nudix superfamily)
LPSHEVKDVVWVNKKEVLQKLNSQHMKELFQVALKAIG